MNTKMKNSKSAEFTFEIVNSNKRAAQKVDNIIKTIGTVEYTDACKVKIDEARKAYDALTDEQKQFVKELKTLENAEKEYEKLKEENMPKQNPGSTPAPNPGPNTNPEETIFDTAYDTLKLVEIANKKGKTTGYTISANSLSM